MTEPRWADVDARPASESGRLVPRGEGDDLSYEAAGNAVVVSLSRDGVRVAPTRAVAEAVRAGGDGCPQPVLLAPSRLRQHASIAGDGEGVVAHASALGVFASADLVAASHGSTVAVRVRITGDAQPNDIEFVVADEGEPYVDADGALVMRYAGGQELRSQPAPAAAGVDARWVGHGEGRFALSVTGADPSTNLEIELFEVDLGPVAFAAQPGGGAPGTEPEVTPNAIRCFQTHTYFGEPYCGASGWERNIVGIKKIDCNAVEHLSGRVTNCESYITDFACGGGECNDQHFSCPPDPDDTCCPAPPPGDVDYCKCRLCDVGESDCDSDAECKPGLFCRANVGLKYGLPAGYDVCEAPCPVSPGHADYCKLCGPCLPGEGDCDTGECLDGDICRQNVGANYGYASWVDVCESSPPPLSW